MQQTQTSGPDPHFSPFTSHFSLSGDPKKLPACLRRGARVFADGVVGEPDEPTGPTVPEPAPQPPDVPTPYPVTDPQPPETPGPYPVTDPPTPEVPFRA